ncbi:MAG: protein-tyrosine-phosphatase [Beijerinckiaceae bacterium]
MTVSLLSPLTVCGIAELDAHTSSGVTDVLTILDPDMPDPASFAAWPAHRRTILRFHDEIAPRPGVVLPTRKDMETILAYGRKLAGHPGEKHLLVHCHMGMSRSTASMATILAQAEPDTPSQAIFDRILAIRSRTWPNSLMVRMADELLGRKGTMIEATRRIYGRQLVNFPSFAESLRSIGRGAEVDSALAP